MAQGKLGGLTASSAQGSSFPCSSLWAYAQSTRKITKISTMWDCTVQLKHTNIWKSQSLIHTTKTTKILGNFGILTKVNFWLFEILWDLTKMNFKPWFMHLFKLYKLYKAQNKLKPTLVIWIEAYAFLLSPQMVF